MRHILLGLALVSWVGGCGGDDDDSGDGGSIADASTGGDGGGDAATDALAGPYARQVVRPSCAPNDALSTKVLLGLPDQEDECAVDDLAPNLTLEVWTRDIEAPITFTFAPGEALGTATLCPGGEAPCTTFESGSITFRSFAQGESAAGTWILYGEGDPLSGSFGASWCEPDVPDPCG